MSSIRVDSARAGLLLAAGVALIGGLLYAPCIGADFVWDDRIVLDEQLPRFTSAREVFWPPRDIPEFSTQYYRPLTIASYLLDDAIVRVLYRADAVDQGRRVVFHASPVALHALASALVVVLGLALVRRQRERPAPAHAWTVGAAGLLFAVHPVHVESVAWIAGRSDVLCAVFFLASVVALVRHLDGGRYGWLAATVVGALAAMLSKEVALGGLALHALVLLLAGRTREAPRARTLPAAAALLAAALLYVALRASALPGSGLAGFSAGPGELLAALGWYAAKSIWPWPLSMFHARVPGGWTHALGALVAAGFIGLVAGALSRTAARLEALATALFMGTLALSLAVVGLGTTQTPVAERYLYLPTAGACLLLAFLAARVPGRSVPALLGLLLLAVPYGASARARTATFRSDLAFWEDAARAAPGRGFIRLHYGVALAAAGRPDDAMAQFERAAELGTDPSVTAPAQNHRGVLLLQAGRSEEALACFGRAIALDPAYEVPHFNRAVALLRRAAANPASADQARREARAGFEEALRLNGRYVKAHLELGALLWQLGETGPARRHLRAVVEMAPLTAEAAEARSLLGE